MLPRPHRSHYAQPTMRRGEPKPQTDSMGLRNLSAPIIRADLHMGFAKPGTVQRSRPQPCPLHRGTTWQKCSFASSQSLHQIEPNRPDRNANRTAYLSVAGRNRQSRCNQMVGYLRLWNFVLAARPPGKVVQAVRPGKVFCRRRAFDCPPAHNFVRPTGRPVPGTGASTETPPAREAKRVFVRLPVPVPDLPKNVPGQRQRHQIRFNLELFNLQKEERCKKMSSHQIGFVRFPFPPTPATRAICAKAISERKKIAQSKHHKLKRFLQLRALRMKCALKLFELERTIHRCHDEAQKKALYRLKSKFTTRQARIALRLQRLGQECPELP